MLKGASPNRAAEGFPLAAKTSQTDIRRGKEIGADDYVTKPFDSQDLIAAVRGRLKRMAAVTGRPARGDVVGGFPQGASPYGVEDMAGNVWEWVGDESSSGEMRVIRGGAWNAISRWAQTFARNTVQPTYTQDNLGFRCAR